MSPFGEEESALPSRQCTDSHMSGTDDQISLRIASPAYSPDLALCDYLLFPKEMVRRKEIHYQKAAYRRNRGLF